MPLPQTRVLSLGDSIPREPLEGEPGPCPSVESSIQRKDAVSPIADSDISAKAVEQITLISNALLKPKKQSQDSDSSSLNDGR